MWELPTADPYLHRRTAMHSPTRWDRPTTGSMLVRAPRTVAEVCATTATPGRHRVPDGAALPDRGFIPSPPRPRTAQPAQPRPSQPPPPPDGAACATLASPPTTVQPAGPRLHPVTTSPRRRSQRDHDLSPAPP